MMQDEQRGAADRLLELVLGSSAHLWHNRPGIDLNGTWTAGGRGRRSVANYVPPGLFVPAAVHLYRTLIEIHQLDAELMAHFASYALKETDWRDLKVACCALMLVQPRAGQPVREDDGSVAFHDDDYRAIGEAMILFYEQGSKRMMTPKAVLRVGELLAVPEIAALNRGAGFADPAGRKPPMGRWPKAVREWLAHRERNAPLLEGLVKAGYKETIKTLARRSGYQPDSQRFFEILGWPQKQAAGGHRDIGLDGLALRRSERFDGLGEAEICERIVSEKLTYKEAIGRLPAGTSLTPAIMAALLPTLSDRDLRIMTPTLESLGLLADPEIRGGWERAVAAATDQRALNIARNVRSRELREKLEEASDAAARAAVAEAISDEQIEVMFLIDRSGSMEGAIEASKEALSRILAGFPPGQLHIALFDLIGTVVRLRAPTRKGVHHALARVRAGGGTSHTSALRALAREGVRIDPSAKLIVIVVGDENGEDGRTFAAAFSEVGYKPAALALIVSLNPRFGRGRTVRDAASALAVPYSEVSVDQFSDPYQVPRVLRTILESPLLPGMGHGWLDRVLATPLLEKPA